MTSENFKITLQVLQVLNLKFHSSPVSALCEGWLQCSHAEGSHAAGHSILPDFFNVLADCCYITIAAVPDLSTRSKPQNPIVPAVQCQVTEHRNKVLVIAQYLWTPDVEFWCPSISKDFGTFVSTVFFFLPWHSGWFLFWDGMMDPMRRWASWGSYLTRILYKS